MSFELTVMVLAVVQHFIGFVCREVSHGSPLGYQLAGGAEPL